METDRRAAEVSLLVSIKSVNKIKSAKKTRGLTPPARQSAKLVKGSAQSANGLPPGWLMHSERQLH